MLSIIIPVINEQETILNLIADLRNQSLLEYEIIVVDGDENGSTINTIQNDSVKKIVSKKSRAIQLNTGAKLASFETLLFLHSDTRIYDTSLLTNALSFFHKSPKNDVLAGHFPIRFNSSSFITTLFFKFYEIKSELSFDYTVNGDQGLLIKRSFFNTLNGYNESLPFLEDQEISKRIVLSGKWITLPGFLETSSRRFQKEGLFKRSFLNGIIMFAFHAELYSFFDQAKSVYQLHNHQEKLRIYHYSELVFNILSAMTFRKKVAHFLKASKFFGESFWQFSLLKDLFCLPYLYPFINLFSKYRLLPFTYISYFFLKIVCNFKPVAYLLLLPCYVFILSLRYLIFLLKI